MDKIFLIALFCLLASNLLGQTAPQCQLDFQVMLFTARKQVSIESLGASKKKSDELPTLYIRSAGEYMDVTLVQGRLSDTIAYSGDTQLQFYLKQESTDGPKFVPFFNVDLGADWTNAIVVLLTPDLGQQKTGAIAVNTSPSNIPSGNILVCNLSPKNLVMKANDSVHPLAPLSPVMVNIQNIQNNVLPVALALEGDDNYELVYRRKWAMRNSIRGVYFLFALKGDYHRWFMKNIIL